MISFVDLKNPDEKNMCTKFGPDAKVKDTRKINEIKNKCHKADDYCFFETWKKPVKNGPDNLKAMCIEKDDSGIWFDFFIGNLRDFYQISNDDLGGVYMRKTVPVLARLTEALGLPRSPLKHKSHQK